MNVNDNDHKKEINELKRQIKLNKLILYQLKNQINEIYKDNDNMKKDIDKFSNKNVDNSYEILKLENEKNNYQSEIPRIQDENEKKKEKVEELLNKLNKGKLIPLVEENNDNINKLYNYDGDNIFHMDI